MFVLDSHCDTPSMLLEGIDLSKRLERGHVDFVRMKEGGVDGMFFAIYTPAGLSPDQATVHALNLISRTYDTLDLNKDTAVLTRTPEEALENKRKGLISVFLGMENGSPIQEDLSLLRLFRRFGISYLTLCHSEHNRICDSCAPSAPGWGGLSPFGKEVIAELNRLGIMVDCSHVSDDTFYDVLRYSKTPAVATHSSCRALCGHPRNMTDQMIRDLAAEGGVIQINFYPVFIEDAFHEKHPEYAELSRSFYRNQELYYSDLYNLEYKKNYEESADALRAVRVPSLQRVADHIDHAVQLVGPEHVGLGSDFDGIDIAPEGLEDVSRYPDLFMELRSRGYSEEDIAAIAGGNFLRVMQEVQRAASL